MHTLKRSCKMQSHLPVKLLTIPYKLTLLENSSYFSFYTIYPLGFITYHLNLNLVINFLGNHHDHYIPMDHTTV